MSSPYTVSLVKCFFIILHQKQQGFLPFSLHSDQETSARSQAIRIGNFRTTVLVLVIAKRTNLTPQFICEED